LRIRAGHARERLLGGHGEQLAQVGERNHLRAVVADGAQAGQDLAELSVRAAAAAGAGDEVLQAAAQLAQQRLRGSEAGGG
jgi:hypothetical protein